MRAWFEKETQKYFKDALSKVYYGGSKVNSSFRVLDEFEKKATEHQEKEKSKGYVNNKHVEQAAEALKKAQSDAEKAQKEIDKMKAGEDSEAQRVLQRVVKRLEDERKTEDRKPFSINKPLSYNPSASTKSGHRPDKLSRCNKSERKLIGRIYNIIINSVDDKTAEELINKIEEEFK